MTKRLRLLDMHAGEQGAVVAVQGGGGVRRRLEALGVRKDVTIVKITDSPFGGPVIIGIGPVRLAIGYGVARKILVEVTLSSEL